MAERKDKPTTLRELLEQWPRAKETKANTGTTSIRVRAPKQQPPRKP
jgi:hypothetical protein